MDAPNDILDEVLATLTPLFTQSGYKKSARNFVSMSEGLARIVLFQTSQLKKPEEATFTLNIAVTSVAFHEAYSGRPFPKNAGTAEPVIQSGIGRFMPDGEPVWWSLKPGVSSTLISDEVEQLLRGPILRFLARFPNETALLKELEHGDQLPGFSAMRERCRAVLLAKNGRTTEAAKVLNGLLAANSADGLEGFRASVKELAGRLGLSL
ncbi:MAG TPA: DUF4304 domain-containing protein [Myxococcales bacterium]|nr:DUF4304 domain-containing protein [Myxococcales bacterium]